MADSALHNSSKPNSSTIFVTGETDPVLKGIEGTNSIATWMFTVRSDYEKQLLEQSVVNSPDEVWTNTTLVENIQRHWHSRGQNGCRFAQHMALNADTIGWECEAVFGSPEDLSNLTTMATVEDRIQTAIAREDNQVLSLLFPHITTPDELARFIKVIQQVPSIYKVRDETIGHLNVIALRIGLADGEVESWLMGFGPFSFFPQTRRAPITEIVIRTKVKPATLFHRLNQDRGTAHLADTQVRMSEDAMERRWQGTYRNTRAVLGGEPDAFSAAKVTFAIPTALWSNQ